MSVSVRDIAWLAGLLEGEGSFFNHKRGESARVALAMTDRDVVERAAMLAGGPAVYERKPSKAHHKTQYWFMWSGHRAIGLMMTIYPFMGERRRAKIKEVIARWKQSPYKQIPSGTGLIVNCPHMARKHYAHGICRPCYSTRQQHGTYA